MAIRVGCTVVAQTRDILYKQLVEYYCSSLSSSLINYTTHVSYQISALRDLLLVLLLDTGLVVAITIGKAIGKPISSKYFISYKAYIVTCIKNMFLSIQYS